MKIATLATLGIGLMIGVPIAQGQAPAGKADSEMKTMDQKAAYAIGLNMGKQHEEQGVTVDPDLLAKGLKDALADKPGMTEQQIEEVLPTFGQAMMAKQQAAATGQGEKNLKDGQAFLAGTRPSRASRPCPAASSTRSSRRGPASPPRPPTPWPPTTRAP